MAGKVFALFPVWMLAGLSYCQMAAVRDVTGWNSWRKTTEGAGTERHDAV